MLVLIDPENPNDVIEASTSDFNLTKQLQIKWDKLHEYTDIFRYKIDNLEERMIDGYLLQLNPNRGSKRRQPEQIDNICQPFDKNRFNFTKASPKEIICYIKETNESDTHGLLVNVSPISRYHSLLCPSINQLLPQVLTEDSIRLALQIMFLAQDRDLRVGFNSLCALASVNHLHYHLFWESCVLPIEKTKCKQLKGTLYCIVDYPVPAFCFEVHPETVSQSAGDIYKLFGYLLERSIAHNVFITWAEKVQRTTNGETTLDGRSKEVVRFIIWPRRSSVGVKQLAAFNVALLELSGWFPVYDKDSFQNLRAEDLENELLKWRVNNFDHICEDMISLY